MLDKIPVELLRGILEQVRNTDDLASLCRTSKILHKETAPILLEYRPLQIFFPDEFELNRISPEILAELQGPLLRQLRTTRFLRVTAPGFENENTQRCYHYSPENSDVVRWEVQGLEPNEKRDWPSRQLANDLLPTLQLIQDNKLEHFSWELGCCIPREFLGKEGWLGRSQSWIKSLAVSASSACDFSLSNPGDGFIVSLAPFRNLTSLSWIGLVERAVADQVEIALEQNAPHLECLELDFLRLNPQYFDSRATRFTASSFLTTSPTVYWGARFPRLRKLSLSNVELGEPKDLIQLFNWNILTHLCLRRCSGAREFLWELTDSYFTLRLKTFEIVVDPREANSQELDTINFFLGSFSGLKNLYMHVEAQMMARGDSIWKVAADAHRSTLRRFTYQAVCWEDRVIYEHASSVFDMGIGDTETLESLARHNPLSLLDLECIGLAARPATLRRVLTAFHGKNLKVLHVRYPGHGSEAFHAVEEVKEMMQQATNLANKAPVDEDAKSEVWKLVDWLFSGEGIASLDAVIFGSFLLRGQHLEPALIAKRCPGPWGWELKQAYFDGGLRGATMDRLVEKHFEFLESAPIQLVTWIT
ncbi:hypothetical protein EDB81DRAFT_772616 [Dactylonectria macrodidyma]|uniref:Uncharacterized protein n=1 Tax=Dactylonectria macrodidyma TaxID=307937 RepID=A0A9P9JNS6_9HYPO|nr:hypothetical protein EDB81DRAFT_772616 [Dactylonectria macrodidyma]